MFLLSSFVKLKAGPHQNVFQILTDVENVRDPTHNDMLCEILQFEKIRFPRNIIENAVSKYGKEFCRRQG